MKEYKYPDNELPTPENNKLLNLIGKDKAVLEIGCAMGFQTRAIKELLNCEVTAIEIDKNAAEKARPHCKQLIIGNIEELDISETFTNQKFDVITLADVLEHLYDPIKTLIKIRPLLKDNGFIIASIPNIAHASVIYEMAHGKFEYRKFGLLDDTHIRFFTKQSIFHSFEKSGYLIASLDRNNLKESDTEFKTLAITDKDRDFMNYIKTHNCESETYQYIVKAIPLNNAQSLQSEIIIAQGKINELTHCLEQQSTKINKLESNIRWIESRFFYKTYRLFQKLLNK